PATVALLDHADEQGARSPTGVDEADRVLGGGLARGSIVLLAGEPGIGKSTLTLQIALNAGRDREVLLVCGEEGPRQVRARAERIGAVTPGVRTLSDPSLSAVDAAVASGVYELVFIDSIQTLYDPEIASAPGSVSQVRECGARLARTARETGTTLLFVGHVTKDGSVAGPRVLEHLVDVVCSFEGDRSGGVRVLRALKNRFGTTDEVGFFRMDASGLVPIRDASSYLLADRRPGMSGSALAACLDGRRPFVCEVQALVAPTGVAAPRRTAVGVDAGRLPVLVAVLGRRLDLRLGDKDVFVSAVGGIRAAEPAADLPVACAVLSAIHDVPLPDDLAAFGEVGLSGEVRRVSGADRRLVEARNVGCRRALVPAGMQEEVEGIELVRVAHLGELVQGLRRLGIRSVH
ncbi:MAG TPA: DNA repair protein RadA, partial [Actinomycetota bacterium]|nr:DNA repair protein RadA [Actinomycetota bacterium]